MCYQQFTLSNWFTFNMYRSQVAKMKCLLHYFERIYLAEKEQEADFLSMKITFTRRSLQKGVDAASWEDCEKKLLPLESLSKGTIEGADGCLQVDFANAYIGGGVLNMGNVQVRIVTCVRFYMLKDKQLIYFSSGHFCCCLCLF